MRESGITTGTHLSPPVCFLLVYARLRCRSKQLHETLRVTFNVTGIILWVGMSTRVLGLPHLLLFLDWQFPAS